MILNAICVSTLLFRVADFRRVLTVFVDVLFVFGELVAEFPLQADNLVCGLRQAIYGVHHQVEAIQVVQHGHVEGCGDATFFFVTQTWILS